MFWQLNVSLYGVVTPSQLEKGQEGLWGSKVEITLCYTSTIDIWILNNCKPPCITYTSLLKYTEPSLILTDQLKYE